MREQGEVQGTGAKDCPWREWQQDWFATPGDIDDFIFYDYDELREPQNDTDP